MAPSRTQTVTGSFCPWASQHICACEKITAPPAVVTKSLAGGQNCIIRTIYLVLLNHCFCFKTGMPRETSGLANQVRACLCQTESKVFPNAHQFLVLSLDTPRHVLHRTLLPPTVVFTNIAHKNTLSNIMASIWARWLAARCTNSKVSVFCCEELS